MSHSKPLDAVGLLAWLERTDEGRILDAGDRAMLANGLRSLAAIELAYGLLWVVPVDRQTEAGECVALARRALLAQLDRDGQARGITAARKALELARESRKHFPTINIDGVKYQHKDGEWRRE